MLGLKLIHVGKSGQWRLEAARWVTLFLTAELTRPMSNMRVIGRQLRTVSRVQILRRVTRMFRRLGWRGNQPFVKWFSGDEPFMWDSKASVPPDGKNINWNTYVEAESKRPPFTKRHLKFLFLKWKVIIPINISLKVFPMNPINNIPALVHIMACRKPSDKPLSAPVTGNLLRYKCYTRPQWVK